MQDSVAASCKEGLRWLVDHKLIVWDRSRNAYAAAPLGKATLAAGLDPDAACLIKKVLLVCTAQALLASLHGVGRMLRLVSKNSVS